MDSSGQKRVCVIGAGLAGLVAVKEALQEGLVPTCYDMSERIGGAWNPNRVPGKTSSPMMWDSMNTNVPKNCFAFSDFPLPADQTPYMNLKAVDKYITDYTDHFKLGPYIRLKTKVVKAARSDDYATTGRWDVYTVPASQKLSKDGSENIPLDECKKVVFDAVYVCSGYFRKPKYPDIKGMDTVTIPKIHSYYYKNPKAFEGGKVLIVGNSLSAADVAEDVAKSAGQVLLAVGRGTWILPRLANGGVPMLETIKRSMVYAKDADRQYNQLVMDTCSLRLDHTKAKIRPATLPTHSPIGMGETIHMYIMSGRIQVCGYLESLDGRSATFDDHTTVDDLDGVIFCTGFQPKLDFVDEEIIQENNRMDLHYMMYPLNRQHNSLVLIGMISTDGGFAPVAEIQARLAVKVTSGRVQLPPQEVMKQNVDILNDYNLERRGSYSYYLPAFIISDIIAQDLGIYPSFWKILFKDPLLAYRVWFGPVYSFHYRLLGPGSNWEEARVRCHRAFEERGTNPCGRSMQELPPVEATMDKVKRFGKNVGLAAAMVAFTSFALGKTINIFSVQ